MSNQLRKGAEAQAARVQHVVQFGIERRALGKNDSSRSVIISTEKPVRAGGGIARAAGAVLGPYMANPVVMWSHDYSAPPIAKCTGISVEPGAGLAAEFEFPEEGIYPLADIVRGLWDARFINAASIGFQPLKWHWKKSHGDGGDYPVFEQWELYEFSLVAIPRDREALRRAVELMAGGRWTADGNPSPVVRPPSGLDASIDLGLLLRGLRAWREVL
jgi:HK97 family phage prohead protease